MNQSVESEIRHSDTRDTLRTLSTLETLSTRHTSDLTQLTTLPMIRFVLFAGFLASVFAHRVDIDASTVRGHISEQYLSMTVDASEVVGSPFWGEDTAFDFTRRRLRGLASHLSPAVLRMGGTDADKLFYDFSESPTRTPPPGYQFVLNMSQFDAMFDFATAVNYSIVFGLNGGPGPRNNTKANAWDSSNARLVLTRAIDNKYPLLAIELSNEPNLFFVNYGPGHIVTAKQLAEDYHHLRAIADEVTNTVAGDEGANALTIVGPDVAYQLPVVGEGFPFMPEFLAAVGDGVIDAVTWHGYLLQSKYCPLWLIDPEFATVRKAMEPRTLDRMATLSDDVSTALSKANISSSSSSLLSLSSSSLNSASENRRPSLWLGEASMISCGGTTGISNAFADSFWWADTLGNMAKHGNEMVMRQTLTGGPYGLLDATTLDPNPDYWVSVLWRRHMGQRVLAASVPASLSHVRSYAHCAAGSKGEVSILLLNMDPHRDETISVTGLNTAVTGVDVYQLTAFQTQDDANKDADNDNSGGPYTSVSSRKVVLNGASAPLAADADGNIDDMPPRSMGGGVPRLTLPPLSITFVVTHGADSSVCK